LPPEHWIAYRLARRLECLRQTQPNLRLGPDGKLIVLYDSEHNCVNVFSASVQRSIRGDEVALRRAVLEMLASEFTEVAKAIPGFNTRLPDTVSINGAGNFAVGGPEGDNGLSGKKLVVDAYGPRVPIGGGALSGKDLFKADRAGAILARRIAIAVVKSGAARECRATVAIFPGDTSFKLVSLLDDTGTQLDANRWAALLELSLESVGETYNADLIDCARHGHFINSTRPWETVRFKN
jgi:S-adenosylmethionine synthetase